MARTLEHEENGAKGVFTLLDGEQVLARMTYSRIDANNIIVDHTAAAPEAKGTGAGKDIVKRMVEWARENDQKVMPLCPFTKSVMERNPELQDVLRK